MSVFLQLSFLKSLLRRIAGTRISTKILLYAKQQLLKMSAREALRIQKVTLRGGDFSSVSAKICLQQKWMVRMRFRT